MALHCTIVGFGAQAVSRKTPIYFIIYIYIYIIKVILLGFYLDLFPYIHTEIRSYVLNSGCFNTRLCLSSWSFLACLAVLLFWVLTKKAQCLEMVNPLAEVVKRAHCIDNHTNRPVVWSPQLLLHCTDHSLRISLGQKIFFLDFSLALRRVVANRSWEPPKKISNL